MKKKLPTPLVNFYLYSLLVIVTPFLMLQNYLQTAIGTASRASLEIGSFSIAYTALIALIAIVFFFILTRKSINRRRIITMVVIVALFLIGQNTADYYFGHTYYDLQNNWHYFAYGIFSYLAFRRFSLKKRPLYKIIQLILIFAFLISAFDEFIQVFISNRIFDLSDVAKDMWGTMIGMVFLFFYVEDGKGFDNYSIRQKKLKMYFTNPFSLLSIEFIFIYCLLYISSNLTEVKYLIIAFLISVCIAAIILLLIHLGNQIWIRWIIRGAVLAVILFVTISMFFTSPNAQYHSKGFITYNHIPVVYFDCMIFPNGFCRLVDKKDIFLFRDKGKIDDLAPDILLLGTGSNGQGGKGWNDQEVTEMVYNSKKQKVCQIIKLKNKTACQEYNRLMREKKKVLFIIHNS